MGAETGVNKSAATDGSLLIKALLPSIFIMGLGHILFLKQQIKGALYLLAEVVCFCFFAFEVRHDGLLFNFNGILARSLRGLVTLGEKQGDHSIFMMIDGLIALVVVVIVVILWALQLRDVFRIVKRYNVSGGELLDNKAFVRMMSDKAFPMIGLSPMFILLAFFVILPILFSFLLAFTNYSYPAHIPPVNKVDWVGGQNFVDLFFGGTTSLWTKALGRVLLWTLIWGVVATAATYFTGLFMAISLRNKDIKIAPVFRSLFILPYAVPATLSLMVMSNLFNGTFGPLNQILLHFHLISKNIPWLTDPNIAKMTMVLAYTWTGFPYHMLMVTSIMTSISGDIFEAADIDGATQWQKTRRITIPLILTQTVPLIIMSFTYNINNFGAAFFLFMGAGSTAGPSMADTVSTNANGIDIVVTWIYKLTMNNPQKFHYASVLAVLVFVVLTPIAIWNYTQTKSYKESDN